MSASPASPGSPGHDPAPSRLGDFEIVGVLGQGGSGVVYDARWGHREVALKVLHPSLVATDKERDQFLTEARRLAEIAHAGVVKVLSVGELADGRPYLAMEKLAGETLAARLGRGALPPAQALRLFAQLADAAQALHARGLVHRDLKPENVVLVEGPADAGLDATARTHAVLLDFGIAKELAAPASTTTQDGGVRGTPAYMAPERFFGTAASIATDVYELGVVLFAMLAGRLPWDDCGDPEVRLHPLRLVDVAPALPEALDVELARALSTRAANRPASARAFAEAILLAAGDAAGGAVALAPRTTAEVRPIATPPRPEAWFDRASPPPQATPPAPQATPPELASAPTIDARPRPRPRRARWPWIVAALAVVGGGAAIAVVAASGKGPGAGPTAAAVDDPWAPHDGSAAPAPAPSGSAGSAAPATGSGGKKDLGPIPPRSPRPLRTELAASLRHFPHDTQIVIGVVIDELRLDPDLAPTLLSAPRAKQLEALLELEGCKLDFTRATDWVALGMTPQSKSIDAIISGRWSRDDIEACFGGVRNADIIHVRGAGDVPLTRLRGAHADRWMAWLDDHTFMISTREDAGEAWLTARVRATDGPGGVIAEQAPDLDRDATAWAIADAPAMQDAGFSLKLPAGKVIARVQLADSLELRLRIRYPDADTAADAAYKLNSAIDDAVGGPAVRAQVGVFGVAAVDKDVQLKVELPRKMLRMAAASADAQ